MDLPRHAIESKASTFFWSMVRTSISKDHRATCDFPGGPIMLHFIRDYPVCNG